MPDDTGTAIPPRRTTSVPPPPPGPKPPPRKTAKPKQEHKGNRTRKDAVKELLGIPMIPLSLVAAKETVQNPNAISPFALDIETLAMYSDDVADSVADLADNYPVLGALLDKIGSTTPFMALAATAIAIGCQIAENHGGLPDGLRPMAPNLIERQTFAQMVVKNAYERTNGNGE